MNLKQDLSAQQGEPAGHRDCQSIGWRSGYSGCGAAVWETDASSLAGVRHVGRMLGLARAVKNPTKDD